MRHIGLKDIRKIDFIFILYLDSEYSFFNSTFRFVAQIVTDINFSGDYLLKGTGLSMLDLSGSTFHISASIINFYNMQQTCK